MSMRTHVTAVLRIVLRGSTSHPKRAAISNTSCLADLGSCTDYQQGGLLQLGSCWYIWPAARPVAVRIECRCPFGLIVILLHNCCLSATNDCRRFCLFVCFKFCTVSLQYLRNDSVTLISTVLLTCLHTYLL